MTKRAVGPGGAVLDFAVLASCALNRPKVGQLEPARLGERPEHPTVDRPDQASHSNERRAAGVVSAAPAWATVKPSPGAINAALTLGVARVLSIPVHLASFNERT
jgi:hypothetical protein